MKLKIIVLAASAIFLLNTGSTCNGPSAEDSTSDVVRELTIFYTNDEHGWMVHDGDSGGAAEMVGQWRDVEGYSEDGPFLILSGGDMWTGPAISTWFQGESMTEIMNAMNYSAAAVGNHEFDFGQAGLLERAEQANFPFLSANMRDETTGELTAYALPYTLVEINQIIVGIIGLTTMSADDINFPENVAGLDFIDYETALEEIVPQVKSEGAELLIVISHLCKYDMEALAPTLASLGIALIGGGHCHEAVTETVNDVGILESGSYLRNYGKAALTFNDNTDTVVNMELSVVPNDWSHTDPEVAQIVAEWQTRLTDDLASVIGYVENDLLRHSDPMYNLITDAWLWAYPADIAMTNTGGIRQDLLAGDITLESWVGILPFENFIVQLDLSGSQIMSLEGDLVVGGMTKIDGYYLSDGTPIYPDSVYTVLTTDYIYSTFDGFSDYDPDPYETSIHWRQPVIDYIQSLQTTAEDPLENYLDYEPRQ
ncbi:MAG: bifunctional metallophosphatase/5'-nucleotidase [FCB group bacterium]|nr:bifunctional metallophosphatase/5'-nucleotidase [FCB group bacterium]